MGCQARVSGQVSMGGPEPCSGEPPGVVSTLLPAALQVWARENLRESGSEKGGKLRLKWRAQAGFLDYLTDPFPPLHHQLKAEISIQSGRDTRGLSLTPNPRAGSPLWRDLGESLRPTLCSPAVPRTPHPQCGLWSEFTEGLDLCPSLYKISF